MLTVSQTISERAPSEGSLTIWAQREVIPFLREARQALNSEIFIAKSYNSVGDGAYATVWTSDPILTNTSVNVEIKLVAKSISGAAQSGSIELRGLFTNTSGTLAQVGVTTSVYSNVTDALIGATISVSGGSVICRVKDNAVSPMSWKILVSTLSTDEQ